MCSPIMRAGGNFTQTGYLMNRTIIATFLAVSCLCAIGFAGQERPKADHRELWTSGRYSLIVGTITGIKADKSRDVPGWYTATLTPSATISGSFDCGAYATIPILFNACRFDTSIKEVPKENAAVMGFMELLPKGEEWPADSGFFVASLCEFMPHESSLVTVKGLDDPIIHDTLVKIQGARKSEKEGK